MRTLGKITMVGALVLGATAAVAGAANGDLDQLRLRLKLQDGSCLLQAEELFDDGATLPDVENQIRLRLRDGTCLADGDELKLRLRTGEDNGQGAVWRQRSEGGGGAGRN